MIRRFLILNLKKMTYALPFIVCIKKKLTMGFLPMLKDVKFAFPAIK